MYNTEIPTRADLPTTTQLARSTAIAAFSAAVILVTIVLPAEYNIDLTGIGRVLGLAEMGEIKTQLSKEAEEDRLLEQKKQQAPALPDQQSGLLERVLKGLFISSAQAEEVTASAKDETTLTLQPGEGTEVKMTMRKGSKTRFVWSVTGGVVNFDMHGDGDGNETSYEKGRAVAQAEGVLEAAFDGKHGWFWRNRGSAPVSVLLKTEGEYSDIKQME